MRYPMRPMIRTMINRCTVGMKRQPVLIALAVIVAATTMLSADAAHAQATVRRQSATIDRQLDSLRNQLRGMNDSLRLRAGAMARLQGDQSGFQFRIFADSLRIFSDSLRLFTDSLGRFQHSFIVSQLPLARATVLRADSFASLSRELAASQRTFAREAAGLFRVNREMMPASRAFDLSGEDPADSLFKVAQSALNRGEWMRAAELFERIPRTFPKSSRLTAAAYYSAFANYRLGSAEALHKAFATLNTWSGKGTASSNAEMSRLMTRVQGALAAQGDSHAAAILASTVRNNQTCDQDDMQLRIMALSALVNSDRAAATATLHRVIQRKDECSQELRGFAWNALSQKPDSTATRIASSIVVDGTASLNDRMSGLRYLSRVGDNSSFGALQRVIREEKNPELLQTAVTMLVRSGRAESRDILRSLIENPNSSEDLRVFAISSLGYNLGGSTSAATAGSDVYLRGIFPKLKTEDEQIAAIMVIGRIGGTENRKFLQGLVGATASSGTARYAAINQLTQAKEIPISEWKQMYDAAGSRDIRMAIIRVYQLRTEDEAVDRLVDIARSDSDPTLTSAAINALGRKDSAKARRILQEIIDRQ